MLDSIVNAISKFIEWFRAPFKTLVAAWIVLALVLRGWIHTFIAAAFWFCTAFSFYTALNTSDDD